MKSTHEKPPPPPSILTEPEFFLLPLGTPLPEHIVETGLIALLQIDDGSERVVEVAMTDDFPRELALKNKVRVTHFAIRPVAYSRDYRIRLQQIQVVMLELARLRKKYLAR